MSPYPTVTLVESSSSGSLVIQDDGERGDCNRVIATYSRCLNIENS